MAKIRNGRKVKADKPEKRKDFHILMVDDESLDLITTSLMFIKLGIRVTTASHGEEAHKVFQAKNFDLLLISLPELNMEQLEMSRHLLSWLPAKDKGIPILLLIPMIMSIPNLQKFIRFDGYINKPVSAEDFKRELMKFHYGIAEQFDLEKIKQFDQTHANHSKRLFQSK